MATPAARPGQLHGCWQTWQEGQVDNVIKTEFESGAVRSRRRFTGINRLIQATVVYEHSLYRVFMDWFNINQQQGATTTYVKDPTGAEIVVQWMQPPQVEWLPGGTAFRAAVTMLERS